jgi:hypothetical protein
MTRLYSYQPSGNSYKVRLLLRHLGIPFETVEIDLKLERPRTLQWLFFEQYSPELYASARARGSPFSASRPAGSASSPSASRTVTPPST